MSVLMMENVSYVYKNRYQTVYAVRDVNFTFEHGKVYAIVGKSGSGKTTMLSMLAGLTVPTYGRILYNGKSTGRMDRDKYRRETAAVIYQGFNLLPLMTVAENIRYPMELHGIGARDAKQRMEKLMELMGLDKKMGKRFPSMLSGGEQQRVAIARAMAVEPEIILADEPTGNLDTENSLHITRLLRNLAHSMDYCVIIVTHDPNVAELADVVLHMADGSLTDAPPSYLDENAG